MAKRNKITYQSKPKPRVEIILTGDVFLQYVDEDAMLQAKKGDALLHAYNDALHTKRFAEYEGVGFLGYFKFDVFDGREWKPVVLSEIFKDGEHHFSKKERPIDTYHLCADIVRGLKGRTLIRTYREHYQPEGTPDISEEE